MEHRRFDELTRAVAGGAGTRRAVFRLLAGGALGGVAARLGLTEIAEAKPKKPKSKPKRKRAPQAERRAQGQLQAEGKRKGKKGKKKPKPKRGPCGPDEKRCDDGSCVSQSLCCPGNRMCADGGCATPDICCVEERECEDGSCLAADQCCPEQWQCADGSCVAQDECCPDEKRCGNGECISQNQCCSDAIPPLCNACQEEVCDDGELVCRPNNAVTCPSPSGAGRCCQGVCCGPDEKCCQGQCTSCPSGGVCGASGTCGCGGENPVSCPPRPERPNGYCCRADHYGTPFWGCHGRVTPDHPEIWGCLYGDHYYP